MTVTIAGTTRFLLERDDAVADAMTGASRRSWHRRVLLRERPRSPPSKMNAAHAARSSR
ncbi:MAG TPA: hypothetical protein VGR11_09425 [Solirubrobacteraceae bacterium]|nr:hypothetical protein [Solirubrobacteraceae bacterium]